LPRFGVARDIVQRSLVISKSRYWQRRFMLLRFLSCW